MSADEDPREEIARRLAARLSRFFARSGWDAVARPGTDPQGSPCVEIRSAEGPAVEDDSEWLAWPVSVGDEPRQFAEAVRSVAARREASGHAPFTTRPDEPTWCESD